MSDDTRTGFIPNDAERAILGRIHDGAPPIHIGDVTRRLVKRILVTACPAQSSECAIRGMCTNKCGALDRCEPGPTTGTWICPTCGDPKCGGSVDMTANKPTHDIENDDIETIIEQERTKRARQRSLRLAITVSLAVFGASVSIAKPEVATPVMVTIALIAVPSIVVEYLNREDARP